MNKKILFICQAAMIAALYIVLTFLANTFGLANGVIQIRLSEALTILPAFTPAAIPGLAIGCFLSNAMTGCVIWDILFGTFATLTGAIGSYAIRKCKWLVPFPPLLANTIIVPFVLRYAYGAEDAFPFIMGTVGIGEFLSCFILGMILFHSLQKFHRQLFAKY